PLDLAVGEDAGVRPALGAESDDPEADVLLRHGVSVLWWVLAPRRARWMRWADVQEGGPPVVARQGRSTRGGVRFDPTGEDPSRTAGAGRCQRSPLAPGGGRMRVGQRLPERHRRAPRGSSSPGAGLRGTDGGPAL